MFKLLTTNETSHLCDCLFKYNLPRVIVSAWLTILDKVSIEDRERASDVLAENKRLLVDGRGVPLFVSGEKIKSVKSHVREHYHFV